MLLLTLTILLLGEQVLGNRLLAEVEDDVHPCDRPDKGGCSYTCAKLSRKTQEYECRCPLHGEFILNEDGRTCSTSLPECKCQDKWATVNCPETQFGCPAETCDGADNPWCIVEDVNCVLPGEDGLFVTLLSQMSWGPMRCEPTPNSEEHSSESSEEKENTEDNTSASSEEKENAENTSSESSEEKENTEDNSSGSSEEEEKRNCKQVCESLPRKQVKNGVQNVDCTTLEFGCSEDYCCENENAGDNSSESAEEKENTEDISSESSEEEEEEKKETCPCNSRYEDIDGNCLDKPCPRGCEMEVKEFKDEFASERCYVCMCPELLAPSEEQADEGVSSHSEEQENSEDEGNYVGECVILPSEYIAVDNKVNSEFELGALASVMEFMCKLIDQDRDNGYVPDDVCERSFGDIMKKTLIGHGVLERRYFEIATLFTENTDRSVKEICTCMSCEDKDEQNAIAPSQEQEGGSDEEQGDSEASNVEEQESSEEQKNEEGRNSNLFNGCVLNAGNVLRIEDPDMVDIVDEMENNICPSLSGVCEQTFGKVLANPEETEIPLRHTHLQKKIMGLFRNSLKLFQVNDVCSCACAW